MNSSSIIEVKDFSFTWPHTKQASLNHVNFSLDKGQFHVITGASGSGKTTLALALAGIIPHKTGGRIAGSIYSKGKNTKKLSLADISQYCGISFQRPQRQFFTLSLKEEIAFSLEQQKINREQIQLIVEEALKFTGLKGLENQSPKELSSGEMQRASLAILFAKRPSIYILDEPFSSIDPQGRHDMLELLKNILKKYQTTIILLTKDPFPLLSYTDQLIILKEGHVMGSGTKNNFSSLLEPLEDAEVNLSQLYKLSYQLYTKKFCSKLFFNRIEALKLLTRE